MDDVGSIGSEFSPVSPSRQGDSVQEVHRNLQWSRVNVDAADTGIMYLFYLNAFFCVKVEVQETHVMPKFGQGCGLILEEYPGAR